MMKNLKQKRERKRRFDEYFYGRKNEDGTRSRFVGMGKDREEIRVGRVFREPGLFRAYLVEKSHWHNAYRTSEGIEGHAGWGGMVADIEYREIPKSEVRAWTIGIISVMLALFAFWEGTASTRDRLKDELASVSVEKNVSDQGYKQGYKEGRLAGLQKASDYESKGWEEGNAYTCNSLYGYGKPKVGGDLDGWRVTTDGFSNEFIAHKATVYYWLLGYSAEVPQLISRKMCMGFHMP